jgi:hypothetical protein
VFIISGKWIVSVVKMFCDFVDMNYLLRNGVLGIHENNEVRFAELKENGNPVLVRKEVPGIYCLRYS